MDFGWELGRRWRIVMKMGCSSELMGLWRGGWRGGRGDGINRDLAERSNGWFETKVHLHFLVDQISSYR